MEELQQLLAEIFSEQSLTQAVLSHVRTKDASQFSKVTIKPVVIKEELQYQFAYYFTQKVVHENWLPDAAEEKVSALFETVFKQGMLHTKEADYQVLISKKFKVTILKKKATKQVANLAHNRQKKYLLEEGVPVPFLIELGVMTPDGKVVAKKYDKFRQINRFLEMIEDVIPHLVGDRTLQIIDFGCGKSYLTFALYHYLNVSKGLDLNVIGLDLKQDVIAHCNALTAKLQYDNLRFYVGDISQYDVDQNIDMVVTLHACDTATDAALEKAVRWNADVILSVPCCQHEMFDQIQNDTLSTMLDFGIIKERFAALATDSVRAKILDLVGYKTQILEFIDLEHTPKNLLIRAVKAGPNAASSQKDMQAYLEFKRFLQIDPYLERALQDVLQEKHPPA